MKTMGSLFDGIGGFPLAAIRKGVIPVWASEIEAFPIKVTQKHFPQMIRAEYAEKATVAAACGCCALFCGKALHFQCLT